MSLGPMAKCKHCGVLSVDEALACEEGDCTIVDWHVPVARKNPHAVALGRLGGLKGGKALAAKLTPAERSARASHAVRVRWGKRVKV